MARQRYVAKQSSRQGAAVATLCTSTLRLNALACQLGGLTEEHKFADVDCDDLTREVFVTFVKDPTEGSLFLSQSKANEKARTLSATGWGRWMGVKKNEYGRHLCYPLEEGPGLRINLIGRKL